MKIKLNKAGVERAKQIAASGAIDGGALFPFSPWSADNLLGNPPDWTRYGAHFLAEDLDVADVNSRERWIFPFVRPDGPDNVRLSRAALQMIELQAVINDAPDVVAACVELLLLCEGANFANAAGDDVEFEVFRHGEFTSGEGVKLNGTPERFAGLVRAFNATSATSPVPLRLGGHSSALCPAVGWLKSLRVQGDRLIATADHVPSIVKQAMDKKLYRKVSAGISFSRKVGDQVWDEFLDHVAILGGQTPAVHGLADLTAYMSADAGVHVFTAGDGEQGATQMLTDLEIKALQDSLASEKARADKAEADLAASKTEAANFSTENAAMKAATVKAAVTGIVEQAIRDGRMVPAQKDAAIQNGIALASVATFSTEAGKTGLDSFKAQIEAMPKGIITFSESAVTGEEGEQASTGKSSFEKDYKRGREIVEGKDKK